MTNFKKKFMRVPNLHLGNAFREIGRNAFVDWILILVISLATAAILVSGGIYLYWQISTGNFKGTQKTNAVEKKVFDEKELADMISKFTAREEMTAEIKRGYTGPTDPSL